MSRFIHTSFIAYSCIVILVGLLALLVSVGVVRGEHPGGGGGNCCAFINLTGANGGIEGGNWALIQL